MSQELHRLIHALSKAERRQLRLWGTRRDGSAFGYMQLYDTLLGMPEFDAETLAASWPPDMSATSKANTKHYLHRAIIRSATQSTGAESIGRSLRECLDEVEFLVVKGLDDMAMEAAESGLSFARQCDMPAYQVELLRWKRRLVNRQLHKDRASALKAIEEEEIHALDQQLLDARMRSLRAKVSTIATNQVYARTEAAQAEIRAHLENPLLRQPAASLGFHARQSRWAILAICHRLLGRDDEVMVHQRETLQDWVGRDLLIRDHPELYLNAMVGFMDTALGNRDIEAYRSTAAMLAAFRPKPAPLKARAVLYSVHLDLRYSLLTGDFGPGLLAAHRADASLQRHGAHTDPGTALTILFNACSVYFLHAEPDKALELAGKVIKRATAAKVREDILGAARILEFAALFDLGQEDALEDRQRGLQRKLRLQHRSEDFEAILVDGFNQYIKALPSEQRAILRRIHDDISSIEGAHNLIGRQEVQLWLQSKLEGVHTGELIRRKLHGAS